MDTTIKTLHGHQEGAEIGYNPHKPGRPSHALHTYWVGNLRRVFDMQMRSGKQLQAAIACARRAAEQLPKLNCWHALVGYICERITGQTVLPTPPPALQGAGQLRFLG